MTENMRARVEKAVQESNGKLTIESAKATIEQKEKQLNYWNNLPAWKKGYQTQCSITLLQSDIAYFEAVIEYLTEQAATEAVTETIQVMAAILTVSNRAKAVRKAVATLANKLHRLNYSLSESFKKSWTFIRAFAGLMPSLA